MKLRQPPDAMVRVAVDLAIFTVRERRLDVLLIQMKRPSLAGRWALPGGRIAEGETVERAAERELVEKTALSDVFLEQLYTFSAPDRDPAGRCVSVAHLALVPLSAAIRATDKYRSIGWFSADRPPPLAFDHAAITGYAVRRLRAKLAYTNVAYSLFDESFTLGELQGAYEAILGRALDPRNFRKRLATLGLVEETGDVRRGGAHRPARLFRFTVRRPIEIDVLA